MPRFALRDLAGLFLLLPPAALSGGCFAAGFGAELATHPAPTPVKSAEGQSIRLPGAQGFNIASVDSQRKAEVAGTARSDAVAKPDGTGSAVAEVQNGGMATATIQLGQALRNESERQAEFVFTLKFACEYSAEATPASRLPDASVGLRLYVRDGRNRLVRELDLLSHATDAGALSRTAGDTIRFSQAAGPGETLTVYVAAQARVEVAAGKSASASLKLSGVELEVATAPAPAVQPGEKAAAAP